MPRHPKDVMEKPENATKEAAIKPRDFYQRPKLPERADKTQGGDWSGSGWSGERWSGRNSSGGRDR